MGILITSYPLSSPVDAGIRQEVNPGFTSEYECREAARFSNYNWITWLTLDEFERAMCIAYMRVHGAIESNVHDAHTKYSERQSSRGR